MVGIYRLKELGFHLAGGAHVLSRETVEDIDAAHGIVETARRLAGDIEVAARRAFEEERERGYREGVRSANLEVMSRLVEENRNVDGYLAGLEDELTGLVMSAVKRLVEDFDDHEKAAALVRSALRQMRREKKAELRIAPGGYAAMREKIGTILEEFPEIDLVDVVEDPTLAPGQVILETSIGRVEADLARNLDELASAMGIAFPPASAAGTRDAQQ